MAERVAVLGAAGYAGAVASALLHRHPHFELAHVTARSDAGSRLDEVHPRTRVPLVLEEYDPERHSQVDAAVVAYLGVIQKMGFSGYFLIVWDFINWAKEPASRSGPAAARVRARRSRSRCGSPTSTRSSSSCCSSGSSTPSACRCRTSTSTSA